MNRCKKCKTKTIPFTIKQTGSIQLTENLGSDPTYFIPVEINCVDKKLKESVKVCTRIYYHASVGWVPATNDDELSITQLLPENNVFKYDEFEAKLINAIDELGATALARLFRMTDALYDKPLKTVSNNLAANKISLKPIVVTNKDVKGR